MPVPITFSSDGYYIVQVDTGIGEQYACVQITKPLDQANSPIAANWNPLDGFSSHYKGLVGGPAATPEDAWAMWREAQSAVSAFGL